MRLGCCGGKSFEGVGELYRRVLTRVLERVVRKVLKLILTGVPIITLTRYLTRNVQTISTAVGIRLETLQGSTEIAMDRRHSP